jgi:hypothetical protein
MVVRSIGPFGHFCFTEIVAAKCVVMLSLMGSLSGCGAKHSMRISSSQSVDLALLLKPLSF